jgi:hypothetical protein
MFISIAVTAIFHPRLQREKGNIEFFPQKQIHANWYAIQGWQVHCSRQKKSAATCQLLHKRIKTQQKKCCTNYKTTQLFFIEIVVRLRNTSYSLDSKDNKCNLREIFCSNNVIQLQAIGYQEICTLDIVVKLSEV